MLTVVGGSKVLGRLPRLQITSAIFPTEFGG
jgi:hypothetical protein